MCETRSMRPPPWPMQTSPPQLGCPLHRRNAPLTGRENFPKQVGNEAPSARFSTLWIRFCGGLFPARQQGVIDHRRGGVSDTSRKHGHCCPRNRKPAVWHKRDCFEDAQRSGGSKLETVCPGRLGIATFAGCTNHRQSTHVRAIGGLLRRFAHPLPGARTFRGLHVEVVPVAGFEPASLAAADFESAASTNSATRASAI